MKHHDHMLPTRTAKRELVLINSATEAEIAIRERQSVTQESDREAQCKAASFPTTRTDAVGAPLGAAKSLHDESAKSLVLCTG